MSQTLSSLMSLLPRFGITRVANITGLDSVGIPTVLAVRPRARSLSVSQGKGTSLDSAKVSAIMESIEQFHAEEADLPVYYGSYLERRRKGSPVDPARLPSGFEAFDPNSRLPWVRAASRSGQRWEVPLAMVHLDLASPLPSGSQYFPTGSNGLASGNSLAEAVAHGAWELIERDALALFYQRSGGDQLARRVKLDTIDAPEAREMLRRFDAAGVDVGIWDMTTDVEIACFLCSIVERELDPFRRIGLARGFGCHLDRGVAVCRALSEAAQSRLTRITGSRDDLQSADFELIRSPESIRAQQEALRSSPAVRCFLDVPTCENPSFEQDLECTDEALERAGVSRMVYVDLSMPDLPFSVARVLIPGLEGSPDVPGYAPGLRARRQKGQS